jgi:beta-glucosidase
VGRGFAALVNATALGLTTEADVDASLARLLTMHLRLGFYDPPDMVPFSSIGMDVVNSPAHRGLAAEAARQGLVLLRNGRGLLPLSAAALGAAGALLVTGPNAKLFATGNYNTQTDHNVTALEGLAAYLPNLAFAPGCAGVASNDTSLIAAAVAAAAAAKVVVAVMGLDGSQEFEDSTRASLALPGVQDALLQALAATGTPVVLVLMGGSAVAPAPATLAAVSAVLWAGYGGEEAGTALADAIFGAYNPGGRLPITHYQSADDLPPYLNMSMVGLPFGRTLRYFSGPAPIYRFGEGRSFSAFALSPTAAAAPGGALAMCDSLSVSLNVSNAGPIDGDTVLQAYVRVRGAPRLAPLLSLSAFERVTLAAGGAAREVSFLLPPRAFAVVDGGPAESAPPEWVLFPASVDVFVGEESPASEADWAPPRAVTLQLTGAATPLSACGPF